MIILSSGYESNFKKLEVTYLNTQGMGYDFNSVMHYGMFAFAADPTKPTINANVAGSDTGERASASENDIAEINMLYSCPSKILD